MGCFSSWGLAVVSVCMALGVVVDDCQAKVVESAADGFRIVIGRDVESSPDKAYTAFVEDFASWWDASHSYTTKAANLSLDLNEKCMLEKLPDGGFVRHMEVVFHQPGKAFRMTGGLGPLQNMGVHGAMTFSFAEVEGKTKVTLTYNVTGSEHQQLDKIAVPVSGVLTTNMDRFKDHCGTLD